MNHSRAERKRRCATSRGESCSRCGKCLTKMPLVLLPAVLLYSSVTTARALQLLSLDVPSIADPRWEKVTLRCEYDLGGEDLYTVKWYKDGVEFFTFMPSGKPPGRVYSVNGIFVDVNCSDSKQVTLLGHSSDRKGKVDLTGAYGCEVSTEAPSFLTTYGETNMTVAVPPKEPPVLDGLRSDYDVGETLEAECTSAPSYPPAVLAFILNGKEVNAALSKELPSEGHVEGNVVSTTRLGLSLKLGRQHFPGGTLSLICQSTLPGITSSRAMKSEKIVTLAASNQRLAQEPPKSIASRFIVSTTPFYGLTFFSLIATIQAIFRAF